MYGFAVVAFASVVAGSFLLRLAELVWPAAVHPPTSSRKRIKRNLIRNFVRSVLIGVRVILLEVNDTFLFRCWLIVAAILLVLLETWLGGWMWRRPAAGGASEGVA